MPVSKHKYGHTFYKTVGRERADTLPLVCLHGGPGGTHFYFYPMKPLGKRRKVVLYDQIGSGRSSALKTKDQTVATLVKDLSILLKKLKVKKFHLLGTSWGGTLALEYYFQTKGAGVASLILQSPLVSSKEWSRDAEALLKTLSKKDQKTIRLCIEAGATDSRVYKAAEAAYYKKYVYRGKERKARAAYFKKYPNPHGHGLYEHMWGPSEFKATGLLKNYDRVKDLKRIKVPTLFIAGQHDEARPETLKKFSRKIPGSRVVVIRGASHSILSEQPRMMLKAVSSFLENVETESSPPVSKVRSRQKLSTRS